MYAVEIMQKKKVRERGGNMEKENKKVYRVL
jgi:hypothetical protein